MSIKLFAFYGHDLMENDFTFLQEMYQKGNIILPLDIPAIGIATHSMVPFTTIDDWLNSDDLERAFDKAMYCKDNWYIDTYNDFSIDGICLPEFDSEAMYSFWFEFFLAETLAYKFLNQKGEQFTLLYNGDRRPLIYYYAPQDIGKEVFIHLLKDKINILPCTNIRKRQSLHKLLNSMMVMAINLLKKKNYNKKMYGKLEVRSNNLWIAINPGEAFRYSLIIKELKKNTQLKSSLALLTHNTDIANEISNQFDIPVIIGLKDNIPQKRIKDTLLNSLERAKVKSKNKPWELALNFLEFHFQYYCLDRWPRLVMDYQYWISLLNMYKPKAIIVSSLLDAESHIPTIAAKQCKIPTFSLPHGVTTRLTNPYQDYILYGVHTQRIGYEKFGVHPSRLIPCKEAYIENQYPINKESFIHNYGCFGKERELNDSRRFERINIVILTNRIGTPGLIPHGTVIPISGVNGQINALKVFRDIPNDLVDKINFHIKVHPNSRSSNIELVRAAGEDLENYLLPVNSDLHKILADCDLVIMLNTWDSSSFIHALKAEKPIILYKNIYHHSNNINDYVNHSVVTVNTANELWESIRKFLSDLNFQIELRKISHEFSINYLDNSNFIDINDIINGKLF